MTDLQAVADELAIQRVIADYAWGCDSGDWALLKSVFTEDATLDYSSTDGPKGSRDEIVGWLEASLSQLDMIQHVVTNHQIDLEGDEAAVRAMFYCSVKVPGMDQVMITGGYYDERFVRTAEGWKIQSLYEDNRWMSMDVPDLGT
jgi:ketosteroid isomerase-like protein